MISITINNMSNVYDICGRITNQIPISNKITFKVIPYHAGYYFFKQIYNDIWLSMFGHDIFEINKTHTGPTRKK